MKFMYQYPPTKSYIVLPLIMLLVCLFPLYFAFYSFILAFTNKNDEMLFYLSFGVGLLLFSLPFDIWAVLHFLKNKRFYSIKPWTGIEIKENQITSQYFNSWKMIVTTIDLTVVEKCWIDSYKRQQFFSFKLKNSNRKINIPINRIHQEDMKQLYSLIQSKITN